MSYGTDLGIELPVVNTTPGVEAANMVGDALEALIAVLETKVTPAGMSMSSDLDFKVGANYAAAINLGHSGYQNKSAAISAATYPNSLYFVDGLAYLNDGLGNQIQVSTSDGELNISSTGGITGTGYGDPGIAVNWSAGNNAYQFLLGTGSNDYADIWAKDVRLSDDSDHFLRLAAGSMSDNYTLTFPTAVATVNSVGNTPIVSMNASGTLTTTDSPQFETLTTKGQLIVESDGIQATPSITAVGSLISTTTTVVGTDLTVGGTATINGTTLTGSSSAITVETNNHLIVAGTGRLKHASKYYRCPAAAFMPGDLGGTTDWILSDSSDGIAWVYDGSGGTGLYLPICLDGGNRITGWKCLVSSVGTITGQLYNASTGATVGAADTSVGAGSDVLTISSLTADISDVADPSSGQTYILKITGTSNLDSVYAATITYQSL